MRLLKPNSVQAISPWHADRWLPSSTELNEGKLASPATDWEQTQARETEDQRDTRGLRSSLPAVVTSQRMGEFGGPAPSPPRSFRSFAFCPLLLFLPRPRLCPRPFPTPCARSTHATAVAEPCRTLPGPAKTVTHSVLFSPPLLPTPNARLLTARYTLSRSPALPSPPRGGGG